MLPIPSSVSLHRRRPPPLLLLLLLLLLLFSLLLSLPQKQIDFVLDRYFFSATIPVQERERMRPRYRPSDRSGKQRDRCNEAKRSEGREGKRPTSRRFVCRSSRIVSFLLFLFQRFYDSPWRGKRRLRPTMHRLQ